MITSYEKFLEFVRAFLKDKKDFLSSRHLDMADAVQHLINQSVEYYGRKYSDILLDIEKGEENGSTRTN